MERKGDGVGVTDPVTLFFHIFLGTIYPGR